MEVLALRFCLAVLWQNTQVRRPVFASLKSQIMHQFAATFLENWHRLADMIFCEDFALKPSGMQTFFCQCVLPASNPKLCAGLQLRFWQTCIVLQIRFFGEDFALNASGM